MKNYKSWKVSNLQSIYPGFPYWIAWAQHWHHRHSRPGKIPARISCQSIFLRGKYLLTEQSVNAWIWKTQKSCRRRERNMMTSPQFCPHWDKSSARRRYCCIIFLNFSCIDIKLNRIYYLFVPEGNNLISIMKKYRLAFCNMNFHWRTRKKCKNLFCKITFHINPFHPFHIT